MASVLPLIIGLIALFAWIGLALQPIHALAVNLGLIASAVTVWGSALWLTRKRKRLVIILAIIPWLPLLTFLNRSPIDGTALRCRYIAALAAYEGTPYIWGGEGVLGIDCSGLPRSARMRALLGYAATHGHGGALAEAAWLWWHDASARAMLEGYQGRMATDPVVFRINRGRDGISPGDCAITRNGVHVMVYLDRDRVIQADPGRGVVAIDRLPAASHWYEEEVRLVRWNPP